MAHGAKMRYRCPVCLVFKDVANHWFLAWLEGCHGEPEFSVRPWNEEIAEQDADVRTVCGRACLGVLFEKWLATAALRPQPAIEADPGGPAAEQSLTAHEIALSPAPNPLVLRDSAGTGPPAGRGATPSSEPLPTDPHGTESEGSEPHAPPACQTVATSHEGELSGIV